MTFSDLPGWEQDDFKGVADALSQNCVRLKKMPADREIGVADLQITAGLWHGVCDMFHALIADQGNSATASQIKAVIMPHFTPYLVRGVDGEMGKFTGYFEAELRGSLRADDRFKYPLYGVPPELVRLNLGNFDSALQGNFITGKVEGNGFVPYDTRKMIESGSLADKGLDFVYSDDPLDVFLLQVQGSGRIRLPDETYLRVGYAGDNGHSYRSIGRYLIKQGHLQPHQASWQGIRRWIEANPTQQSALFAQNPRFIFFRQIKGEGPLGAFGVPLTAERSLAIDPKFVPLGQLIWVDTVAPYRSPPQSSNQSTSSNPSMDDPKPPKANDTEISRDPQPFQRLMFAQDTGNAIKGAVRGDVFWGFGDAALAIAGRMNSQGRYWILVPKKGPNNFSQNDKSQHN